MAYKKDTMDLSGVLLECLGNQDLMLHMLEWLYKQLMEMEVSTQLGARVRIGKDTAAVTGHDVWIADRNDIPACTEGKKRRLYPIFHHGMKA